MKASIAGVDYFVTFEHTELIGHTHRVKPTVHDTVIALRMARMEILEPGLLLKCGVDAIALIDAAIDAYDGAMEYFSHRTGCFIWEGRRPYVLNAFVSGGITHCSKQDQFQRAKGRWFAFQKAISIFPLTQQVEWLDWLIDSGMNIPEEAADAYVGKSMELRGREAA